jgi:hypothetical protein
MIRGGASTGRQTASPLRHVRPPLGGSALITTHQINLFCMPELADTGCLKADHNESSLLSVSSGCLGFLQNRPRRS